MAALAPETVISKSPAALPAGCPGVAVVAVLPVPAALSDVLESAYVHVGVGETGVVVDTRSFEHAPAARAANTRAADASLRMRSRLADRRQTLKLGRRCEILDFEKCAKGADCFVARVENLRLGISPQLIDFRRANGTDLLQRGEDRGFGGALRATIRDAAV